jgi:hypothetical protein
MATAAPHVKLLRQLASAKDDYLSGAFDISWDGAKATLYLVFGRPSHAVFDTDQAQIEGEAAIDALLAELPRTFIVSDWRRAMSPQETLSISIDELAGPFVRLAGSYADDPVEDENPEWWSGDDSSPDLAFGLADFPLLPGGRPLWAETTPENVNLAERLAELPPSILILTGARLRAAAVVSGGDLIDAVWIDNEDQARGEAAGMAILGATKGSLAGYALDDPRVAEALTMLWRLPLAVSGIEMSWLDPASMLAAFRADGLDRVLVIDAPVRGIALFSRGGLVAVYSETQRSAVASPERLRSLLSQARGRLTVMERKPRSVGAVAGQALPSATEFFAVLTPEAPADLTSDAEAATATPAEAASDSEPEAVEASDVRTEEPAPEPVASGEAGRPSEHEFEAVTATVVGEADDVQTAGDASEPPPPPPPDAEHAPPPEDADIAAVPEHVPPPPAPDSAEEPTRKTKRHWWAFGRSRKNKSAPTPEPTAETIAAEAAAAHEAAEAAEFAGWSVRQPNPEPQPIWLRSHDMAEGSNDVPAGSEPPPPIADTPVDEAEAPAPVSTWSVVEPGTVIAREPSAPSAEHSGEAETATPTQPDTVAAQGWSARDVLADSVGWYRPAHPEGAQDAAVEDEPAAEDEHAAVAEGAQDIAADSEHEGSGDAEHEPAIETENEPSADEHGPVADEHELVAADRDAAGASDPEPHAEASEEVVAAVDHAASAAVPAPEPAHDFWAEFASSDPDADAAGTGAEPEADPEPATVGEAESDEEPAAVEHPDPVTRKPSERTVAPWSWPLAEAEPTVATGSHSRVPVDETPEPATATAPEATESENWEPVFEGAGEQTFFQRDEPVGSQFVDFDEVRTELVQIGVVWLGETNAVPVTALLLKTRSTIDDFVATIDTIRGLHLEGQDPASIQAMAREMHQQAAERLCGA